MDSKLDEENLHRLVEGQRFTMFTTTSPDGRLVSRPMTVQEMDGWLVRFIAQDDSQVTVDSEGRQVNLAFIDGATFVSLSGVGSVDRDVTKKRELWDRLTEAYAGEPDDPANVIVEVQVHAGEFWEGGNPVSRIAGLAKAVVTGQAPDGGHGSVEL